MDVPQEYMRAVRLLAPELRRTGLMVSKDVFEGAEELRLRVGQAPSVVMGGKEMPLPEGRAVTPADIQMTVEIATRASVHAHADSIRMGYVTAEGGCRLGLCGTAVTDGDKITALRRLTSVCIRIPHEKIGCGESVLPLLAGERDFESTLIISPPGEGKTTLLRDITRLLSEQGQRISLVDERGEVAGVFEGAPCFDVGPRTDILTGAPKVQAIGLVLRAMSPQIIAFDEITDPKDVEAAERASNCGVGLLATAHAGNVEDLSARPLYRLLLERRVFRKAVTIKSEGGRRSYSVEDLP